MSLYKLDKVFKPSSVAIIGASNRQGSIGHSLVKGIVNGGFEEKVFPVNSRYRSICDLHCFPYIKDVGQPDLLTWPLFQHLYEQSLPLSMSALGSR